MARKIADGLIAALEGAGIPEVHNVRRVVIDLQAGHVPLIHVERFGDERILELVRHLDGLEIRTTEPVCDCPDIDVSGPEDLRALRQTFVKGWSEKCPVHGHRGTNPTYERVHLGE